MTPAMVPVDSTSIEAVGYDETARALYIRFTGGATYVYDDVPPTVHRELLRAESRGGYVNRAIRGSYSYRTV